MGSPRTATREQPQLAANRGILHGHSKDPVESKKKKKKRDHMLDQTINFNNFTSTEII